MFLYQLLTIPLFVDNVAVHSFNDVVLTGYADMYMLRGGRRHTESLARRR
jgi:hypothetical protein